MRAQEKKTLSSSLTGSRRADATPSERRQRSPGSRFDFDFSRVKVHHDETAASAADSLGARAFTFRENIYFARGAFQPGTARGRELIDHELEHVQSQARGIGTDEHRAEIYAPGIAPTIIPVQMADDDGRSLTEYKGKGKKPSAWKFSEDGKSRWMNSDQIGFLKGAGFDIFLAAKAKGFSTFGALFVIAHASLESGWGVQNWISETHNFFSVMGGSNERHKTKHGILKTYASTADAFDTYIKTIGSSARWPKTVEPKTGLYFQASFTIDEVNRAFHQKEYYKPPVYNADKNNDYGRDLFKRMAFAVGPLIILMSDMIRDAPEGSELKNKGPQWIVELETAASSVAAALAPKPPPITERPLKHHVTETR